MVRDVTEWGWETEVGTETDGGADHTEEYKKLRRAERKKGRNFWHKKCLHSCAVVSDAVHIVCVSRNLNF